MGGFSLLAVSPVAAIAPSEAKLASASSTIVEKLLVDPLLSAEAQSTEAIAPLPDVIFPRPLLALAAGIGLYILGVMVYLRKREEA